MRMYDLLKREGFWITIWLAIASGTILLWPGAPVSPAFAITTIWLVGFSSGRRLFSNASTITSTILASGTILALQSVLLTIAYYSSISFSPRIILVTSTLSGGLIWLSSARKQEKDESIDHILLSKKIHLIGIILLSITLIVSLFVIRQLVSNSTSESLRSPWPYLHPLIPTLIASLSLLPLIVSREVKNYRYLLPTMGGFLFCLALITPILYTQGFGFDGFLHRESERLLITQGTLEPKPFYYIGQYSIVAWITTVTNLEIATIDRYLLTVLLIFFLFAFGIDRARHKLAERSLALLFIPLAWSITTTPQSLALLFGITAILLHPKHRVASHSLLPAWIFALWSLVTHPLAGIPFCAAIFGMSLIRRFEQRVQPWMIIVYAIGSAVLVPFAFFLFSLLGKQPIVWDFSKLYAPEMLQLLQTIFNPKIQASLWPDLVDAFSAISTPLTILLAFVGWKTTEEAQHKKQALLLLSGGVSLMASAFLLKSVSEFTFLIAYERSSYADRLSIIGLLLLSTVAAKGLWYLLQKPRAAPHHLILLIFLWQWQTARIYNALPRMDSNQQSHGYSVSSTDKQAVFWIEQQAHQQPYTVLANQSMSAASIEKLGFKRYVNEIFYYPIPTGGPLYEIFLRTATTKATMDDIREAAELTKSEIVFVAIHEYWWDAKKVNEHLSTLTSSTQSFDHGAITVYRFDLKPKIQVSP